MPRNGLKRLSKRTPEIIKFMMTDSQEPFQEIRRMSAEIIRNSNDLLTLHLPVVEQDLKQRLEKYRASRKGNPLSFMSLSPENEIGLILFYNAINFCYRDPATGQDYVFRNQAGQVLKSTAAMMAALLESSLEWNRLEQVAAITSLQWQRMFQLEAPNVLYLGMQRRERVTGLAAYLQQQGFATVMEFIEAKQYDVLKLTAALKASGFFEDEFLKRLQVALKRIDGILAERMNHHLEGMHLLTCMADYSIPQLLYNMGVVELNANLRRQLQEQEPIQPGSREELALRAAVVVIAEPLAQQMDMTEAQLNNLLWEYAVQEEAAGRLPIPHMLVATDKY